MSAQILAEPVSKERLLDMFVADCHDRQLTDESIRHYKAVATAFLNYLVLMHLSVFNVDKFVIIRCSTMKPRLPYLVRVVWLLREKMAERPALSQ